VADPVRGPLLRAVVSAFGRREPEARDDEQLARLRRLRAIR
jgi:hypothetical protein